MFDGGYITDLRTAAAGAVAVKHLARSQVNTVAVIGTGGQARLQVRLLGQVRRFRELRIWGRRREAAEQCVADLRAWGEVKDVRMAIAATAEDAVCGADLVHTVTASRTPIVDPSWVGAGTPYCLNDEGRSNCMSCIGFVLRVLYPGRRSDFPNLPRAFERTGAAAGYTPNDLLLFLTGMTDLPSREARLQRLSRLTLPDELREDLEMLVHLLPGTGPVGAAPEGRRRVGTRSTLRRPL